MYRIVNPERQCMCAFILGYWEQQNTRKWFSAFSDPQHWGVSVANNNIVAKRTITSWQDLLNWSLCLCLKPLKVSLLPTLLWAFHLNPVLSFFLCFLQSWAVVLSTNSVTMGVSIYSILGALSARFKTLWPLIGNVNGGLGADQETSTEAHKLPRPNSFCLWRCCVCYLGLIYGYSVDLYVPGFKKSVCSWTSTTDVNL